MAVKDKKSRAPLRHVRATKTARATIKPVEPAQILGRAMLANVCISIWEGRKHDAEVTAEVSVKHKAAPDAGRYHKKLFSSKTSELSAIISAASTLRRAHYDQTLPWSDSGWRLLPTANYMEYTAGIRKAIKSYNEAADAFVDVYEKRVREAQQALGDMWKADDYPSPASVRAKYRVDMQFSPLPAGSDFRVTLPTQELERVARDVEDRLVQSVGLAMQEAWKRLGTAISKLRDKLDDGKHLRESVLENLKEVAEGLERFNLTDDAALDAIRKQVVLDLASFDAETLRKDPVVRADVAASADAILKAMEGVYTPADDEEDE